ncbi:MAG TPA: RsmD family RNA methyltransferase [Candidatus Saccharimonadales bacterium]|nr:RsmD family RNA methyltransferase [Candidatus Saccharimonadales bacterium]
MRIIAGNLGGRTFASPPGHKTHPMSDKVRGGLFNVLGDIAGLSVLDAFAGSGALGFEAASRGAKEVVALDADRAAQRTIAENIAALGLEGRVKLIKAAAGAWFSTTSQAFDLIICDPPYDDLQVSLIERLGQRVKSGGLLILSWPGSGEVPAFEEFEEAERKLYGDAQLVFYRKIS